MTRWHTHLRHLFLAFVGASGCTVGLAESTAAPTGCAEEDIRIRNAHNPFLGQGAPTQWNATCNGVTYYCTQMRDRTICSEDPREGGGEHPTKN